MGWRLALLALCCFALPVTAQSWYEVEVLVFSQSHPELYSAGASQEEWPESLHPAWPAPLVRLESAASPSPALRPLPTNQRRLNNDAYALRVTAGYEVLWHQAWLQPMLQQNRSPWIRIEAGAEVGGRFPLEGSLRIYLERFLHLETDLWLNEFVAAATPAETEIPPFSLPPRELVPPACQYFANSWPAELGMESPVPTAGQRIASWWFPPFDCGNAYRDLPAGLPLGAPADPYLRIPLPRIRYEILSTAGRTPAEVQPVFSPAIEAEESAPPGRGEETVAEPAMGVSQIIPVRQSRRMRSGELHYIDHPRLGLLVLISPVEPPLTAAD